MVDARASLLTLLLTAAACGPDQTAGGTAPIGDGTATGTAASGEYLLESLTTACTGTCAVSLGDGITLSVCDVGARLDASATLTQSDGHLEVDSDDSDYVSHLEGGLDADGAFEVAGTRTDLGGAVTSRFTVTGTLSGVATADTTLDGVGRGRVAGTVDGKTVNCNITVDVSGERAGGGPE